MKTGHLYGVLTISRPGGCQDPGAVVKRTMVASILARLKDHLPLSPAPAAPAPDLVAAGVLVPLFVQAEALQVLFTQRTLMVKDHPGPDRLSGRGPGPGGRPPPGHGPP
jgi:hypothetical protein